jgi:hypothetical protein
LLSEQKDDFQLYFPLSLTLDETWSLLSLSLDGRKGGQASSEDLFPLGYGERERVRVRVKPQTIPLPLTPSRQGRVTTTFKHFQFMIELLVNIQGGGK